jgi:hypothetical protein
MPKVSVIIPNYNHARYLAQRLDSVLNQSFQDFEIIVLDDASNDDSLRVLERYLGQDKLTFHFNERNSGNTFHQWNKGFSLAQGEYLWIAESDDYADYDFLATLVPLLDAHQRVGLAYTHSWQVDAEGGVKRYPFYDDFLPERWQHDFINSGLDECKNFLCFRNTVPNASAVLLRRVAVEEIGGADEQFRLTGDWMLWIHILLQWDVAFVARPLNYYRHHSQTVRNKNAGNGLLEQLKVIQALIEQVTLPDETTCKIWNKFAKDWSWTLFHRDIPEPVLMKLVSATEEATPHIQQELFRQILRQASLLSAHVQSLDAYDIAVNDQSLLLALRIIHRIRNNVLYQKLFCHPAIYPVINRLMRSLLK